MLQLHETLHQAIHTEKAQLSTEEINRTINYNNYRLSLFFEIFDFN